MPTNDLDEIQISFPDIIQTIWELRIPAILLAVIGDILGILISAAQPDSYVTTASMVVTAKTSSGLYQDEASMPGIEDFTMARNLADYVQFLATTNKTAINISGALWYGGASFVCVSRHSIAGSSSKNSPNFLRNYQIDFPSSSTRVYWCPLSFLS